MRTVVIEGKSRHGKNRVREQGSVWTLKMVADKVQFTEDPGPWLLLESLDRKHSRWVHRTDDKDFVVRE